MSAWLGILVTVVLLLLNGVFVAAEFALVSARRASIEPLAQAGSRRAAMTLRAMEQVSTMMAGAQLGITLCSVALGAVSEPIFAHLLEPVFESLGLPAAAVHPVAFALALTLVTVLHVVIGEMVPKNIALAEPEGAAQWLTPVLGVTVIVARPLIWSLNHAANLALRLFRVQPREEVASAFTRDEVAHMVEESHRGGLIEATEHDLLGGALAFDTATAGELALPLASVHSLSARPTPNEVEALAARSGVSRFPVRSGADLVGYVHLKDTLGLPPNARRVPLPASCIRTLAEVSPDASLPAAVEVMRAAGAHIVQVKAHGATVGVLTLDDVLASLVRPAGE